MYVCIYVFIYCLSCCSVFLCVCRETLLRSFGWETVKQSQITSLVLLSALIVLFQEESTWVRLGLLEQMQSCIESVLQTCAHVCDGQGGSDRFTGGQAASLLFIFILHLDCALLILQIFSMRKSLMVSFPLFPLVFRAFCCLEEIQTEGSGLSRRGFVSRSTRSRRLFLWNLHPLRYLWPPEKMRYFLFPFCAAAVLCWTEHSGR